MKTITKAVHWNVSRLASPDYAPEFGIYANGNPRDLARVIGENSEANAHLIAASPELLESCKLGLAAMIAWGGRCEAAGEKILAEESRVNCETIRYAIAKAEGK